MLTKNIIYIYLILYTFESTKEFLLITGPTFTYKYCTICIGSTMPGSVWRYIKPSKRPTDAFMGFKQLLPIASVPRETGGWFTVLPASHRPLEERSIFKPWPFKGSESNKLLPFIFSYWQMCFLVEYQADLVWEWTGHRAWDVRCDILTAMELGFI